MAIKSATFETLYSLDKKTFERKCKPALKPSEYIPVKRLHLFYFMVYIGLGLIAITALSQILSNNPLVSVFIAVFLLLFSIRFARDYFSQLVSGILQRNIEKEES